jgi:ribosomal protein S18 acetylase RimI-like enzyme
MVVPHARRRGVALALMRAAEAAAVEAGRSLVVLDTREGDAAEPLYRLLGWIEAGRIPGYAQNPDGSLHATVIFYKALKAASTPA